ncbi:MAG: response regulator [Lachnospiraceae bacterium]|jgi:CheY-like chemotaxis protein|nr:response regulator [Lachnospiraceae bacterium]
MKYKTLLAGNNASIIDSFFTQMGNCFEAMTTSLRGEDIMRHVNYFAPNVFIYCLHNETRENMSQMGNIKYKLSQENIPFVIIGAKENCDEFERVAVNVSDMSLYRPLSAEVIRERITTLLQKKGISPDQPKPTAGQTGNVQGQPNIPPSAGLPGAQAMPPVFGQPLPQNTGTSQRKHILVVDDNSMMLRLVKEHLHEKYDVATALSGKIALKFLRNKKTDLILLDYEMPDENGPAVLEKLRASDATKNIPVVFLTGVTESKKIKEALIMKPQSYLLKPINRERLMDTIEKLIG